ncbi:hypothetical protein [Bacillus sp. FJAT-29937]|uniref:hypothetical protein n=1 Tax=Bacillus sp. FJAT-29937 TaxID=1720553 RepID=UPI00083742D6|nr:hypothetical protein [Bacillus sp. FJAT-29937]
MKKKAIKLATSTAIAASAFVAAAPANQADAAVNVDQLVQDAQNAGTVLKWAISVEGSADYVTRPYAAYNAAKQAIEGAQKALKGASASDKLKYEARLTDPQIQVKRATAYIDAITSSEKIKELTAGLDAAVKSGDIEKVEAAYHKATAEFRKQSALLDRVYGQSTRDGIRNAVKPAIEKLVADTKNDVTVNMLAKAAAADVKAGKLEDASKKLSEAQAILDANVLKWETSLQKSVDDVAEAMPLKVLSISADGKNTVTVKFSKQVASVLPASQFTFDNGLLVQSAVVGADKKTVTLTTTNQKANTTYTLAYQGEATGVSFKTSAATVGNITVDASDRARLGVGETRTYTVTLKNADGLPYVGSVAIGLYTTSDTATAALVGTGNAKITSANGVLTNSDAVTVNSDVNGKVTFTIEGVSGGEVYPFVSKNTDPAAGIQFTTEDYLLLGRTSYYALAGNGTYNGSVDPLLQISSTDYIDLEGNRLVTSVSSVNTMFKWDDNDKFYIQGVLSTQEQFEAALSNGDTVHVNYNATKANTSVWSIVSNVTLGNTLDVVTPSREVSYDGTGGTYRITGTGQPGHKVNLYKVNGANTAATQADYLTTATVDSNGVWTVQALGLTDGLNDYKVVQYAPTSAPVLADAVAVDTIHYGNFEIATATLVDTVNDGQISIGDTIDFTFVNEHVYDHNIATATNATITLTKGLLSAKFNVKRVDNDTLEIVSINGTLPNGFDATFATGKPSITAITNVKNQDSLELKHKNNLLQ